jgi:hypothetical protein
MREAIGLVLAVVFVAGGIAVLLAIVWFSIISPRKRRGSHLRLHTPNPAEVAAKWNVKLPTALEELYAGTLVDGAEVCLAAPGADRSWHFYEFIPLTVADISEALKISRVPGLPIALDGDKGTYYLPFERLKEGQTAPVLLRLPGGKREDVQVSSSVEQFLKFEMRESPSE